MNCGNHKTDTECDLRLPEWLRNNDHRGVHNTKRLLRSFRLSTVCEEARCPNVGECFSRPTAAFMILGSKCTRNCGFCAVDSSAPDPPDREEPARVAMQQERPKSSNFSVDANLPLPIIPCLTLPPAPFGGPMKALRRFVPLVPVVFALACGSSGDEPSEGGSDDGASASVVPPGKADDYLSPTSREYRLWGEGQLDLDAEWADKTDAEKLAHAKEMLGYKFKAYAHFIDVYVTDKSSHDTNADYGGFSGLVRPTSLDSMIEPTDATSMSFTFLWELEMGGPRSLMSNLPLETNAAGEKIFKVKLPVLTESQLQYGSYPKDFDAAKYTGELEEIEVAIDPEEESFDAFPEYNKLFEDGKLDVLILVGGDYNEERYDLKAAEEIFKWLKQAGYQHPAAAYTDLKLDSPPFKASIDANGKNVD
ncbi:hypothetical protein KJ644_05015, partial [Candidatus Dependentiae bacterium]|nr:hypothetical protein [Candidatus Dependentiae bacterium]